MFFDNDSNHVIDTNHVNGSNGANHTNDFTGINATMWELQTWYKCSLEKLGWMVLAKNDLNNTIYNREKIKVYYNELIILQKSIINKISSSQDRDRKNDLTILQQNLSILIAFVNRNLITETQAGGSKKTSKKQQKKLSKKTMKRYL